MVRAERDPNAVAREVSAIERLNDKDNRLGRSKNDAGRREFVKMAAVAGAGLLK